MSNHETAPTTLHNARKLRWLLALVAPVLAILLYFPVVTFDFVWDDLYFVVLNEDIRFLSNIPRFFTDPTTQSSFDDLRGLYRPARNISYAIDYQIFGLRAGGFHLTSLLLHAFNAFLVFWFVGRLMRANEDTPALRALAAPLFAATLFAVHPLATEAVCWIKSRDDLLVTTFSLLGAGVAAACADRKTLSGKALFAHIGLYVVLHLAALASKETGVVFPGFVILAWLARTWRIRGFSLNRPLLLAVVLLAGIGLVIDVAYILARAAVIGEVGQLATPLAEGSALFWTQTKATGNGLLLAAWPARLLADYNAYPISTGPDLPSVVSLLAVIGLFAAGILTMRRQPMILLAAGWWFLAILTVSNIVPTMQFLAERFLYLALVAVAILGALVIERLLALPRRFRRIAMILPAIAIILLSIQTYLRIPVWTNQLALFESIAVAAPQNPRGTSNYARELFRAGRHDEADDALDTLEAHWPDHPALVELRADIAYMRTTRLDPDALFAAIQANPSAITERLQLAEIAWHVNRYQTAMRLYDEILALADATESDRIRARAGMLIIQARSGDPRGARQQLAAIRENMDEETSRIVDAQIERALALYASAD